MTSANAITSSGNTQIDARLAELDQQTARTQRRLFWQSALLAPLTLIAILALTLSIGRPLRAIDRAISELGRGTFSRSIEVSGPRDLERLGAQLEWLRLRLLDLAQERNRFLRHMSHELKTPLANIREGAELLMDGAVGPMDNAQREVVAILRDNGIKLHRLIENLLSFSAWQKESVGLDLSEFRIRPLVKQVIESQQLTVVSQRVRLEVKVDDLMLRADRGKVRLIIENLLSNAIKYSPKGGTVYLHAAKQDTQLVIDVADMGSGIPAEERARCSKPSIPAVRRRAFRSRERASACRWCSSSSTRTAEPSRSSTASIPARTFASACRFSRSPSRWGRPMRHSPLLASASWPRWSRAAAPCP